MSMKKLGEVITDIMLETRKGVSLVRLKEMKEYVSALIAAKEAELDPTLVPQPMFAERATIRSRVALAAHTTATGEGRLAFEFVAIGGRYGREEREAAQVDTLMEFRSVDEPKYGSLAELPVDDLKKLLTAVEKQYANVPSLLDSIK